MPILHICPICQAEFVDNPSKPRTYCSKICQYQGAPPPRSQPGQHRSKPSTQITHLCVVCKAPFKDSPSKPRTYCSKACQYHAYRQSFSPWEERFWKYVSKAYHPKGCWLWIGAKRPQGYGIMSIQNQCHLAHRVSYEMHYGSLIPGIQVCHCCDNPPCVRPSHLFIGTAWDNNQDALLKGSYKTRALKISSTLKSRYVELLDREISTRISPP